MAHLKPRPVFDPRKSMIVLKTFRAAGRRFTPGEDFNWKQMGLAQRRVQQMYEGSFLRAKSDTAEKVEDFDFDFDLPAAAPEATVSEMADAADSSEEVSLMDLTMPELRKLAEEAGVDKLPRKKADLIESITATYD